MLPLVYIRLDYRSLRISTIYDQCFDYIYDLTLMIEKVMFYTNKVEMRKITSEKTHLLLANKHHTHAKNVKSY